MGGIQVYQDAALFFCFAYSSTKSSRYFRYWRNFFTADEAVFWLRKPKQHIVPYVGYYYCEHEASTTFLRHREAEQRLYRELNFYRSGIRMRCLIAYTKLRLRLHFWMTSVTQDPNIHTI